MRAIWNPRNRNTLWRSLPVAMWIHVLALSFFVVGSLAMSNAQLNALRIENDDLFYHGFESYLQYAFPEDELRPLNCSPLTRDRANPHRFELNDPLGNYSLTLVDTLSTLAVLASSGADHERNRAFKYFQDGIIALVELYGDGSAGIAGQGNKSRGFDLDSKVSVFETVIRGVGGLLSAHLFAVGDLPIKNYFPDQNGITLWSGQQAVRWSSNFIYDGQLLRLAEDLASRLMPAFATSTGIPYPRVNLRYGIPFYMNTCGRTGELCFPDDDSQCPTDGSSKEDPRTCPACAGTLMLEFIVLSRLTGNHVYENAAKRAFWSIWERKTLRNLVGSDIDAETGEWLSYYTGVGAGIDSFYEYAFKTYILLSGAEEPPVGTDTVDPDIAAFYPPPLRKKHHHPESFLKVWQKSHSAIDRYLRRDKTYGYPHFIQGDASNGAARAFWMDALSAFYPGLLTLAGRVDEAIENHVLFTALWSRYSAIPERWSVTSGDIEHGLSWWLGRPEFIESNYYLYRATKDPWYLHVGEMVLKDIKRLCWVPCGLSGIQDVRTFERNNRMESFFLGETAKYLHLLFAQDHPLNTMDAPFVFSTEGHPLIIPKAFRKVDGSRPLARRRQISTEQCEVTQSDLGLSVSKVASRSDLFHASALVRLQLQPKAVQSATGAVSYDSPTNFTFFPWTLPTTLIPHNGTSALQSIRPTFDVTFPLLPNDNSLASRASRTADGFLVKSLSGLRLSMIQDIPFFDKQGEPKDLLRIHSINHFPLGPEEQVLIDRETIASIVKASDPLFARIQDQYSFDLVVDLGPPAVIVKDKQSQGKKKRSDSRLLKEVIHSLSNAGFYDQMQDDYSSDLEEDDSTKSLTRHLLPAIRAHGAGAAPLPNSPDIRQFELGKDSVLSNLPWTEIYVAGNGCSRIAPEIPRTHQVIVFKRGGCSFGAKLANIPSFPPSERSLQLVIVVSFAPEDIGDEKHLRRLDGKNLIWPLIDEAQVSRSGIPRRNPIPLAMIGGGERVWNQLVQGRWRGVGIRRRYTIESSGIRIGNVLVL